MRTLSVNVTVVTTASWVRLNFTDALTQRVPDLALIPELRTAWRPDPSKIGSDGHEEAGCSVLPSPDAQSYWVGQFSPAVTSAGAVRMGANPNGHGGTEGTPPFTVPAPVKFISGTQLSRGAYDFKVTSMRDTTNWVLFAGSLTSSAGFEVVALSPTVRFSDADAPSQLRLARTSSVDEMRVSWTSSPRAAALGGMEVQWGAGPAALTRPAVPAASHTYGNGDLCGAPANSSGFHHPGVFFSAVLDLSGEAAAGRIAGQRLFYRVGSDAAGWSAVHNFWAPKPVDPHAAMSIVVTADMGETYEDGSQYHWEEPAAVNTTEFIARTIVAADRGADIILHPGDLAYATGYESEWDRFMSQIEPLAANVPYMTGQGNHERDFPESGSTSIGAGDSGGECGIPTQARFQMPCCPQPNTAPCLGARAAAAPPAIQPHGPAGPRGSANDGWYSFEQGAVHFLMLNTRGPRAAPSRAACSPAAQRDALDQRLAAAHLCRRRSRRRRSLQDAVGAGAGTQADVQRQHDGRRQRHAGPRAAAAQAQGRHCAVGARGWPRCAPRPRHR